MYAIRQAKAGTPIGTDRHTALHRGPAPIPTGPIERWSIDFVPEILADGRPFRILTVVDNWSRHSPMLCWEWGFACRARQPGRSSIEP